MTKFLIVFGFGWLLTGNFIGLILAKKRDSHLTDVGELSTLEGLLEHYKRDWDYRWNKTCHAHSSLFSVVCVIVGVSLNTFDVLPSAITTTIVITLVSSVILWTVFSFRSIKPVMAAADAVFIGSIAATVYVLFTNATL